MLQESEFIKNLPQHLQRDYLKQCFFFARRGRVRNEDRKLANDIVICRAIKIAISLSKIE